MSQRTPQDQVPDHGSAKAGTGHFVGQRVSGVAMLLLGLWFAGSLATLPGFEHADAVAFIGAPLNGALLVLLVVSLAYHSSVGIQVVIEDYVHGRGLHLVSLTTSRLAHSVLAVASIYAIIKIGLGA